MAASALEFLSLDDAKAQLRLDGDDQDRLVTLAIENAVSYVANRTGLPLVDRSETLYAPLPYSRNSSIVVPAIDIKAVTGFEYWIGSSSDPDNVNRAADPNGSLVLDPDDPDHETLRIGKTLWQTRTEIWRPAGDWPSFAIRTEVRVTVNRGYTMGPDDEGLRQVIVLMMRHFFEAPERFESDFAVNALLVPYIRRIYG